MSDDFDLVVLGSGPAGEKGAAQAAYFGKRVAIVERAPAAGGACVHWGTVPSKTLREAALFLSGFRDRQIYGVSVELKKEAAAQQLMSRKQAVIDGEVARIDENLALHGVVRVAGEATLRSGHEVEVRGTDGAIRRLRGESLLIATGSSPNRPRDIPFTDDDIEDSDEILRIDRIPTSVVVLGGGVIGCEYATMFAALDVRVTLVEGRDRLLGFLDVEMSQRLEKAMVNMGITVKLGTKHAAVRRVAPGGVDGVECTFADGSSVRCSKLLVAAGRRGNTEALNLAAVGVVCDSRGYIEVDDQYRTSVPTVFAAGDVIGFPALASTSMEQARVAVCHAFGFDYKRTLPAMLPYGIYTIPEVSFVGETEESCAEKKIAYAIGRASYRENTRGKIVGDSEGMLKLIFEVPSKRLLGVHIIGDRATELVHIGQVLMQAGGTIDTFVQMVFNYPTLSEIYKYAAYDGLGRLQQLA